MDKVSFTILYWFACFYLFIYISHWPVMTKPVVSQIEAIFRAFLSFFSWLIINTFMCLYSLQIYSFSSKGNSVFPVTSQHYSIAISRDREKRLEDEVLGYRSQVAGKVRVEGCHRIGCTPNHSWSYRAYLTNHIDEKLTSIKVWHPWKKCCCGCGKGLVHFEVLFSNKRQTFSSGRECLFTNQ